MLSKASTKMLPFRGLLGRNPNLNSSSMLFYSPLRALFIKDANTPNPHCRKFMPGKPVMTDGGTMDFSAIRFTHISPMARKLFGIDGVNRVFYGKDFISVTKNEEVTWEVLKPEILGVITD